MHGFQLVFPRAVFRDDLHGVPGVDPFDDFEQTFTRDELVGLRDRISELIDR